MLAVNHPRHLITTGSSESEYSSQLLKLHYFHTSNSIIHSTSIVDHLDYMWGVFARKI